MKTPEIKRCLKVGISLVYFVMRVALERTLRLFGRPTKRRLTVLYYHGVSREERARFAKQMETLRRTACVLPAFYQGVLPAGKKHVAITFDDAFVSVYENAMPELFARSLHSTIFVPTNFLGRSPGWMMEDAKQSGGEVVMTVDQLKGLSSELVTLGSHSSTHVHLSQAERGRARDEIERSRQELQRLIGRDVRLFSFPYGDYDAKIVELCRNAGYDHAFTIQPERIETEKSSMLRGRVKVDPTDWPIEFFLKSNGAYTWMTVWTAFKHRAPAKAQFAVSAH
jgi:peptidoglycan/xylan/chitin deacetylase (PgdA/CDA1 family)